MSVHQEPCLQAHGSNLATYAGIVSCDTLYFELASANEHCRPDLQAGSQSCFGNIN